MVTTVSAIYRHPVKGLSAEKMDRVALMPGECLPHDRRFAIALGMPKSGSHVTHRWRRESGANPSLKWGFRRLGTTGNSEAFMDDNKSVKGLFRARKRRSFSLYALAASPVIGILNC